jgi:hypothetical protein
MLGAASPSAGERYWRGGLVLEEVLPGPGLQPVSTSASIASPLEDFGIDATASLAVDGDSVGEVSSSANTFLILPSRDSSSSATQPGTHSSPPPSTPVAQSWLLTLSHRHDGVEGMALLQMVQQ